MKAIIRFYQLYISPLNPPSCRFYPSCSEYSMLCFRFQNPILASIKTISRLLRCNHLFRGGLEYPVITLNHIVAQKGIKIDVTFWLVPKENNKYYIIRNLKGN
ncbi:membrane protein insertion efficiency factor YidD [Helicobacter sp. 16-1353]|uniref:membrane protein insertion efficiency factor YidD n=1 Tax=Helicobacter sp. 16-1353 TaxID=2004996 RepID=UPI000DCB5C32|nr:membrane protein insertion efficiency factor YidD [Helicobacter sp. 16-1353]RAX53866.1 membrane protein insertion efficiency factor YidD [Helicobacter sp. 16-1353]